MHKECDPCQRIPSEFQRFWYQSSIFDLVAWFYVSQGNRTQSTFTSCVYCWPNLLTCLLKLEVIYSKTFLNRNFLLRNLWDLPVILYKGGSVMFFILLYKAIHVFLVWIAWNSPRNNFLHRRPTHWNIFCIISLVTDSVIPVQFPM